MPRLHKFWQSEPAPLPCSTNVFYSTQVLYPPAFSLSHVPLSCEKWFGTAGAQSKILHWKEMKLVFVRQTRVPAVKVRLELTAGVEYICLRRRVKLYFV